VESPEREEPSGALLAFDGQAPPYPIQEVSDASAPSQTRLKRAFEVRFMAISGRSAEDL
jgi:hypothetical protein